MQAIQRIHHISAIVGHPQENLSFYRNLLGLRLVKKTVNYENPDVYHLYFGNEKGDIGTLMTFFPRNDMDQGRQGSGQVGRIAFAVPKGSLSEWEDYLAEKGIAVEKSQLFFKPTLEFSDPHQLKLALVESDEEAADSSITGFYGVVLESEQPSDSLKFLTEVYQVPILDESSSHYLLKMKGEEGHKLLIPKEVLEKGKLGVGTVHHIAWSVEDNQALEAWAERLKEDFYLTELKDRKYFSSLYFLSKDKIIYEMASDEPGLDVDEPLSELGQNLQLPPFYEEKRQEIEANLPKLD